MNWTQLLTSQVQLTCAATEVLLDRVDDDMLDWKPAIGEIWMTTGQLLLHQTTACGFCLHGFLTGDWTPLEGCATGEASESELLPPAEKLATADRVLLTAVSCSTP